MNTKHKKRWGLLILCPPLIFLAVTGVVMWLWNTLLPEIIGVKEINYWQAMGILVLSKILFGGFHGKFGRNNCGGGFRERKQMMEKMGNFSSEEREKFREMWKQKCSGSFFQKNNE
ncbi:hypothetical protein [Chryseobacterium sp.]|uniref:hypothetical protein n=1 Tax=Chryseobacterium sp. TaxID=1871047 RepID=UPI0025C13824|nr:hypothetical protein [Chryseobacterium sp.]